LFSGKGKRTASAYSKNAGNQARLIIDAVGKDDSLEPADQDRYRLRLFFGRPDTGEIGPRVFDVYVEEELMLQDVMIKGSRSEQNELIHVLDDILVDEELNIRFEAKQGKPLLSGLELIRQRPGKRE
jgi:hypothetical protein